MKLQYRMELMWDDYRLKWNRSEFGNINYIDVHSSEIWTPDLLLHNKAKVTDAKEITPQSNYVTILADGDCIWRPRFELSVTHCHVDVTWFPFDVQRCDLEFSPWRLTDARMLNITVREHQSLSDYTQTDEWNLQLVEGRAEEAGPGRFSFLTFTLRLRRLPLYYVVNLIVPCCLLSFITLTTFLLPPGVPQRSTIAMQILLAMVMYQIIISGKLPATSASVPIIVLYFLFLISMCVVLILVTAVVHHLHLRGERKPFEAMPTCMKSLFCKGLAARLCIKQSPSSALERGEADKEIEMKNDWMLAAAVFNRISAIVFTIILVGGTLAFFVLFAFHP